jgi:adenosylcobinamide kinase/adenosylcobinamide-phosphate guanylyltransferase
MNPRSVILIGGGPCSGKSAFALLRACREGEHRTFVATARPIDGEIRARIEAHRAERDATWVTREEPLDLARVLAESGDCDVLLVDCLTLWLGNLLIESEREEHVEAGMASFLSELSRPGPTVVLVTNEVGFGLVPEGALGRRFRDLAGRLHREVAALSQEVYLSALGCLLRLAPGPVEVVRGGGT